MQRLLYWLARSGIALLQALPLPWVARLGRRAGALANLTLCFGREKSPGELRAIARGNFASGVKTAAMTSEQLRPHFTFISGGENRTPERTAGPQAGPQSCVVAIGHFGNFELYARFGQLAPTFQCATTYCSLRQPVLDRRVQSLRETAQCRFFERRTEAAALKAGMASTGLLLGLLADQHAGGGGVRLPFLGHECGTSTAAAVFALRYYCPLHTAICYRVGLARWVIEVDDEIPTRANGDPRSIAAIMGDVNHAFEIAVRRDPANWFWVHKRWKLLSQNAKMDNGG